MLFFRTYFRPSRNWAFIFSLVGKKSWLLEPLKNLFQYSERIILIKKTKSRVNTRKGEENNEKFNHKKFNVLAHHNSTNIAWFFFNIHMGHVYNHVFAVDVWSLLYSNFRRFCIFDNFLGWIILLAEFTDEIQTTWERNIMWDQNLWDSLKMWETWQVW